MPLSIKGVVSRQRLKEFFSRAEVSIYKEKSLEVKKAEAASKDGDPKCDDEQEEESNDEDDDNSESNKVELPKQTSVGMPTSPEVALSVRNGYFAWPRTSSCVLRDISLEVRPGTLNAVVGPSGSGKTALVSALLEEMDRVRDQNFKGDLT